MFGKGLIQGLGVTAKNFIESFSKPERMTTVEYPEQKVQVQENYRNFPFLVFDEDPANPRCVACKICEKECPPQCIYIEEVRDEKGKAVRRPAIFDIDYSVCMSCQICVEACPFDAIKMDQVYELSTQDRFEGLLFHKEDILKPNDYFGRIHPTDAKEINLKLREAADKKKKADEAKAKAAAAAAATPKPPTA
ncbi:MAG: NADH-quinone oxidoreductase subunit I [Verrucomicrobiae bacterium]|nr:NADH-quinone oxidoreductase subunit I [Verrucomicrobiae bacterium]